MDEYIKSLNKNPRVYLGEDKREFSLGKVFLAIVICLGVIAYFFKGENLIDYLTGTDLKNSAFDSSSPKYACDEYYSNYADSIKPDDESEYFREIKDSLAQKKLLLDEEKAAIEGDMSKGGNAIEKSDAALTKRLEDYNKKVLLFNDDYDSYEKNLNLYNAKVKIYNDFLNANCGNNLPK